MKGQLSEYTGAERDRKLGRIPKNPREREREAWQRETGRGGDRESREEATNVCVCVCESDV